MKNNTNILYGIIGLLSGVIIVCGFCFFNSNSYGKRSDYNKVTMHKMPDGTMMQNVGMDMDTMMQGMMVSLSGKTGDAFDKAFIEEMIVHHEGAVLMAESALKSAKHQEIKNLANNIISAQNKEISDMKSWYKSWYGEEIK